HAARRNGPDAQSRWSLRRENAPERRVIQRPVSSASKIWSNCTLTVPGLLEWCRSLSEKINGTAPAVTGSKLDLLSMGEPTIEIPTKVLFAQWDKDVYSLPPMAHYSFGGGERSTSLTEFDLTVEASDTNSVFLLLTGHGLETKLFYNLSGSALFSYLDEEQTRVNLVWGRSAVDLVDYLNDNPLHFILDDWSRLHGEELYTSTNNGFDPYNGRLIKHVDWKAENIRVGTEFEEGPDQHTTVQGFLVRALDVQENDLVYWDHGSGETADFVTMSRSGDGGVNVTFYHCKGSSGPSAGNRVGDVYEVCGQAVKGLVWCDIDRLVNRLEERKQRSRGQAQFIRGDLNLLRAMRARRPVRFSMVVVQPGITGGGLEQKIAEVLAAASGHLVRAGHNELVVWGSS
ncbi:hypothetical protein SAMN02745194_05094, partial [Roseomonas rosea]